MNIVKLRDVIKEGDDIFNEKYKGKYAFFVHMKYIVSFDDMDIDDYIACESMDKDVMDYPNIYVDDLGDVNLYLDIDEMRRINSVDKLIVANLYTTTPEVTIDDVKVFRTWLATELNRIKYEDEEINHVLLFYMKNMVDDTVKYLELYGKEYTFENIAQTGCNCCNHKSSDLSSLYNTNISMCDCVAVYKAGIHNKMVKTFSDILFWSEKSKGFLKLFKIYIENILKLNLPLGVSLESDFVDCCCQLGTNENMYNIILKNLITSLEYIINDDISGHKLFIQDSFNKWADLLYETMIWA